MEIALRWTVVQSASFRRVVRSSMLDGMVVLGTIGARGSGAVRVVSMVYTISGRQRWD